MCTYLDHLIVFHVPLVERISAFVIEVPTESQTVVVRVASRVPPSIALRDRPLKATSLSFRLIRMSMDAADFQESNPIMFEWTLRGLKDLFESRCGGCDLMSPESHSVLARARRNRKQRGVPSLAEDGGKYVV